MHSAIRWFKCKLKPPKKQNDYAWYGSRVALFHCMNFTVSVQRAVFSCNKRFNRLYVLIQVFPVALLFLGVISVYTIYFRQLSDSHKENQVHGGVIFHHIPCPLSR